MLPIAKLHESAFDRLFLGKSELQVREWAETFLEENFTHMLYTPAVDRLKKAQDDGHTVMILSSSADFLIEPIAKRLGVPHWRATQYAVDKDRHFCRIAHMMLGEGKAEVVREWQRRLECDKSQVTAYSDSLLDLPFLLAAGKVVAVNPDRRLRVLCARNHWEII